MNALLGELGKRLAERWLTLLVLPGALYIAAAAGARALGQSHPAAEGRISAQIKAWSKTQTASTTAGQVLLLLAILAAAAAAGLAAQALGAAIERIALAADWDEWFQPVRWLAERRTRARRTKWDTAHLEYSTLYRAAGSALAVVSKKDESRRLEVRRDRNRIALERPQRPTWSGDRINAAAVRLKRDLQLDLGTLWPPLWLSMPDTTRTQVTEARQNLARATTLAAWAVMYALLIWWWYPAAVIAAVLAITAWRRTREASETYATLLESAARIHLPDLARTVGIPDDNDRSPAETAKLVMARLRPAQPMLAEESAGTAVLPQP